MRRPLLAVLVLTAAGASWGARIAQARPPTAAVGGGSLTDTRIQWPSAEQAARVLSLRDHNTRVVLFGTVALGVVGGVVGTLMLLRKRALIGDVVSHACLPGIALAFLVLEIGGAGSGKNLPVLLSGALVAGLLGLGMVLAIRHTTRIKEDTALAIVLSIFFGLGVALLTVVQKLPTGNAAGLQAFIFGRTSSLVAADALLVAAVAAAVTLVCLLLFKELAILVCFDEAFAAAQGWPVRRLDVLLMALVAAVTVIGLESVGLLLVVAMLIIPAAAARFWSDRLPAMMLWAAILGGLSAAVGVILSALVPRVATGAIIVVVAAAAFVASLLAGPRRGLVPRWLLHRELSNRVARHDLLRAFYERMEEAAPGADPAADVTAMSFDELLVARAWPPRRLRRLLRRAVARDLAWRDSTGRYQLTAAGWDEARRVVRNHRLWELYLIAYADRAPSRVDQTADLIEHALEPAIVQELERQLDRRQAAAAAVPPSPHEITPAVSDSGRAERGPG